MHIERYLTTYAASLLLIVAAVVKARCPHNALNRVQDCTNNLLPNWGQDPVLSDGPVPYTDHVQVARSTCRDSRLRDAAECIESIMDSCRGTTEQEQVLQRLIDKDKLLDTVDYFCRHFRVYEKNAQCIQAHHGEVAICSEDAQQSFSTKVKAGATMDVLITGSCRFHSVARRCLTETTEKHCGNQASSFVYTLMTGLMPPYCTENPEYRPGGGGLDSDPGRDGGEYPNHHGTSGAQTSVPATVLMSVIVAVWTVL